MVSDIAKAMDIACKAHKEQKDKGGCPYICHPLTVASKQRTEEGIVLALLHDVVEDTSYTIEDMKKEGFSDKVTEALKLLTHDKNVPYMDYISAIKDNDLARNVKIADLEHNSDLSRLKEVTEEDEKRVQKYMAALNFLKNQ